MKKTTLSDLERLDWLRLIRTENVGPITFYQLLARYGSARQALEALPALAHKGGRGRPLIPPALQDIETEIAFIKKSGGHLLCACEPDYPERLAAIEDAPPVLTVFGDPALLHKKQLAIVGARNASINGRKMAERLTGDLAAQGYIITSGLARGIDTTAHSHALATGTIAVVAGGVDIVYPEENRILYERIIAQGCVVSEQPAHCEPRANLFPKRNRIIAGLSLGVIVIEAAKQSGSLITARMALEQGREVFAVPGSPLDPRSAGTNDLLRQGATLTESAADVLESLNRPLRLFSEPQALPFTHAPTVVDDQQLDHAREKILENLSPSPVLVDELVRQCQLSLPLVLTVLLELELAGRLDRQPGHQVALIG